MAQSLPGGRLVWRPIPACTGAFGAVGMLRRVIYFLCVLCCVIYQLCTYIRYGRKMFWSVAWCGEDFRWHLSLALQNHYKHTQWHRKWCHEWIYTVGGRRHNTAGTQYYVCDSNPGHVVGIIHCESDSLLTIIHACIHPCTYACRWSEGKVKCVCPASLRENWNLKQPQWGNSQLYSNIQYTIICAHSCNSPS